MGRLFKDVLSMIRFDIENNDGDELLRIFLHYENRKKNQK